jgi:hypothetical protein
MPSTKITGKTNGRLHVEGEFDIVDMQGKAYVLAANHSSLLRFSTTSARVQFSLTPARSRASAARCSGARSRCTSDCYSGASQA